MMSSNSKKSKIIYLIENGYLAIFLKKYDINIFINNNIYTYSYIYHFLRFISSLK